MKNSLHQTAFLNAPEPKRIFQQQGCIHECINFKLCMYVCIYCMRSNLHVYLLYVQPLLGGLAADDKVVNASANSER